MNKHFVSCGLIFVGLLSTAAAGQTAFKSACMNGFGLQEPLGEGRTLSLGTATCRLVGGPVDGATAIQNVTWDVDNKGVGTLLSGDGLIRRPGAVATFKLTSGTFRTLMQDGKPAGWVGEGAGVYTLGHGAAAALNGKQFKWSGKMTGPTTYETAITTE